jgi:hypothetical protein
MPRVLGINILGICYRRGQRLRERSAALRAEWAACHGGIDQASEALDSHRRHVFDEHRAGE